MKDIKIYLDKYLNKDLSKLFSDYMKLYNFIFYFYNTENVEFNFKLIDEKAGFVFLNLNSLAIYNKINIELKKRRVFIKNKDFNKLFAYNCILFKNFFDAFYSISKSNKICIKSNNSNLFKIYNSVKEYKEIKIEKTFKIKNFNKSNTFEQFALIFDKLVLMSNHIIEKQYLNFMKKHRKAFSKEIKKYEYFDIRKHKNSVFLSKINFNTKSFKNVNKINVFIDDIDEQTFLFLLKFLNVIFNNNKYKLYYKKPFYEFKRTLKNNINVFLTEDSSYISKDIWTTTNKYILSKRNLKEDLMMFFNKNLYKNEFITQKDYDEYSFKERKVIYNFNYYASKRTAELIEKIKKEEIND